jgi:hypothetical protein
MFVVEIISEFIFWTFTLVETSRKTVENPMKNMYLYYFLSFSYQVGLIHR